MTDCPVKLFDGCHCAPGQCQSFAVHLQHHRARSTTFAGNYASQATSIGRLLMLSMIGCVALVGVLLEAERQLREQDIRQQETSGQYARVVQSMELRR
jgi:hypothetical protein